MHAEPQPVSLLNCFSAIVNDYICFIFSTEEHKKLSTRTVAGGAAIGGAGHTIG